MTALAELLGEAAPRRDVLAAHRETFPLNAKAAGKAPERTRADRTRVGDVIAGLRRAGIHAIDEERLNRRCDVTLTGRYDGAKKLNGDLHVTVWADTRPERLKLAGDVQMALDANAFVGVVTLGGSVRVIPDDKLPLTDADLQWAELGLRERNGSDA